MIGMTVCSGIGSPEVAAPWIDWRYQSEIEPFPSAVLAQRFPHAINLGDMTKFKEWQDHAIDVLCGGTPCQSFSIAGLRKGLDDPRGNLMLTYLAIADRYRPRWLVWENVPGVLSSNGGRDFGAFLGGLGQLGYGFAYRVLDAQYVRTYGHPGAVPQRRRRVFVVGYLGDWRRAAAVLLERESLSGNPAPRRKARKDVAPTIAARTRGGGGLGTDFDCDGGLITSTGDVSHCLNAGGMGRIGYETETMVGHALRGEGFDASEDGTGRGTPIVPVAVAFQDRFRGDDGRGYDRPPPVSEGVCGTLETVKPWQVAVAFDLRGREGGAMPEGPHDTANIRAASGGSSRSYVVQPWAVRRLTPLECERLQGFPDGHTAITYRGKPAADGQRYKALGNSMAVNCMTWLFDRIRIMEKENGE